MHLAAIGATGIGENSDKCLLFCGRRVHQHIPWRIGFNQPARFQGIIQPGQIRPIEQVDQITGEGIASILAEIQNLIIDRDFPDAPDRCFLRFPG